MNHPWRNVGASGIVVALILGGGGPALAADNGAVQEWTSLSAEVQKLYDYRTSKGLVNGQDWQQTCSTFGEFHSSVGAQMFIDDNDEDLNSTSVIRFQNARSELMTQDGVTYNMFVVDLAQCYTPAPTPTSAPASIDNAGKDDYIVIPEGYSFNDSNDITSVLPAGKWKIPDSYYVNGAAKVTIELSTTNIKGNIYYEVNPNVQHVWTYTFDGRDPVAVSAEPTVSDGKFADDTFTVPASSGYSWHLSSTSGPAIQPGTYKMSDYASYVDGKATVSLYPVVDDPANYVLSDDTARTVSALNYETATAQDPSSTDGYLADDHFTLPSVEGGDWYVNGVLTEPGTYSVGDKNLYDANGEASYTVTLAPKSGYRFSGKSEGENGGSWTFKAKNYETVAAPTIETNDGDGPSNDYFVLPDVTGVEYTDASGTKLVPGKHYATGDIKVNISTTAGFKFTDMTTSKSFSKTLDPTYLAGVVSLPDFVDGTGDSNVVVLKGAAGITWNVNGKTVEPGTHKVSEFMSAPADKTALVVAWTLDDGYRLRDNTITGPWTHTFDSRIPLSVTAPTFTDVDGPDDSVAIPSFTGITWTVNGKTVEPGTYSASGQVVVSATPNEGYMLDNGNPAAYWGDVLDPTYVSEFPGNPTSVDDPGTTLDTFTVAPANGVTWTANGKDIKDGTFNVLDYVTYENGKATIVLRASAATGFHLPDTVKTTSWTLDFEENAVIANPASPTWNGSTVTIPEQAGVAYYYNDVPVYGTIPAIKYGTMTIEARAVYGYEFADKTKKASWTHDYDQRTKVSPVAPTSLTSDSGLKITFPEIEGMTWAVDGKDVFGTVDYPANSGKIVVQAVAKDGYVLSGTSTFTYDTKVDLSNNGDNSTPDNNVDNGNIVSNGTTDNGNVVNNVDNGNAVNTVSELRKTGSNIVGTASLGLILLGAGIAVLSVRKRASRV